MGIRHKVAIIVRRSALVQYPQVNWSCANFHEKALFVKADLAASVWPSLTGPALRAMLPCALSESQLSSDSVHYGIRLFGLPRRRCNLRNGLSYS